MGIKKASTEVDARVACSTFGNLAIVAFALDP